MTPAASADELRAKYETLLDKGRREDAARIDRNLYTLRRLVLVEGIPSDERDGPIVGPVRIEGGPAAGVREHGAPDSSSSSSTVATWECGLRARVWKILLRVPTVSADRYADLVRRGAFRGGKSEEYKQIRKDIGRTGFRKHPTFLKRVPDGKLSRVLNALLHSCGTHTTNFYASYL